MKSKTRFQSLPVTCNLHRYDKGDDTKKVVATDGGGFWECDAIATADAAAAAAAAGAGDAKAVKAAAAEKAPVVASAAPAPAAPLGLPSKLKERWNALYDPASAAHAAKRAKKDIAAASKKGGGRAAVEAAKAAAAAAAAAAPPVAFNTPLQAEVGAVQDESSRMP
jgi:hypothetical protein